MPASQVGYGAFVTTGAAAAITPVPPAYLAHDTLLYFTGCGIGSATIATPGGWTLYSKNNLSKQIMCFGIADATGSDTIPSVTWSGGNSWACIGVYRGMLLDSVLILDGNLDKNGSNAKDIVGMVSSFGPAVDGEVVIQFGEKNKTATSNTTVFTAPASFLVAATNVPGGGSLPAVAICEWIQGTKTSVPAASIVGSVADGTAQTTQGSMFLLKPAAGAGPPPGEQELPGRLDAARRPSSLHEFWQVAIELRTIVPPSPPPASLVAPDFILRAKSNVMLSIEQGIPAPLRGTDQMLTPVDWQYGWDTPQLPAALRGDSKGLDVNLLTALLTNPPYLEFNWSVPAGPRQWNRSFEASVNLCLLKQDKILLAGPNNLQWDPPPAARQPAANRGFEQQSLALFYSVPLKPPLSQSDWPVPAAPRRAIPDFIQGMPNTILAYLSTFPPFQPSVDLPPRRAVLPPVLIAYEWSRIALLKGQDILPFGTRNYDQLRARITYNADLYTIAEASQFLIPTTTPLPPSGLGVKHMGRVLLDPAKVGEAVNVPIDFISGLAPGETLVSASTIATLYAGTDPNPQAIIVGAATVSGSIAFQKVQPTLTGNIYDLRCTALTSQGQILGVDGYFAIVPGVP